jgi:hypothetical protein
MEKERQAYHDHIPIWVYQDTTIPRKEEPRHHQDNASQLHLLQRPPPSEACNFGGFRRPLF